MKNFIKAFTILSLAFTLAACGVSEAASQSRATALEWANADYRVDGDHRMELLTKAAQKLYKDSSHTNGDAAFPDRKIDEYTMKEWKVRENSYVYQITFRNDKNKLRNIWTQTVRTDDGWRITDILLYESEINYLIEGIQPVTVKELSQ